MVKQVWLSPALSRLVKLAKVNILNVNRLFILACDISVNLEPQFCLYIKKSQNPFEKSLFSYAVKTFNFMLCLLHFYGNTQVVPWDF